MADLPILFSAPMVRAILREIERPGTGKTQTRRVLNPQPRADMGLVGIYATRLTVVFGYVTPDADCKIPLRYVPGDRLYVREAWRALVAHDAERPRGLPPYMTKIAHEADGRKAHGWVWGRLRPGMFLPRWASRITLIVTDVRVQRLQEIGEDDARAEGVEPLHEGYFPYGITTFMTTVVDGREVPAQYCRTARDSFRMLWNSLNASRGYGWDANPWVAAYTFRPILGNIDQASSIADLPTLPRADQ